jgi:hypothetical protein
VIFLGGVRFAYRSEAKGRHRFRALPKSFHHQLLMWIKNVTAFAKRSGSTIDDIESVDRKHNLKTKVATVPHNNGITATFFANDEPAIANNQQPGAGWALSRTPRESAGPSPPKADPNFSCRRFYRKDPGMTISFPFLPRFRFNIFAHE